jgi:hypothetical protein
MWIAPIGQTSTHCLHLSHFSSLMVMAPPNTSMALFGHSFRHGALVGVQFIQNKEGVSTSLS